MRHLPLHHLLTTVLVLLILATVTPFTTAAKVTNPKRVPRNAVLLSKIASLTLHSGKQTAARRSTPIPQLQCIGPANVCKLYSIDTMRCTNEGGDYDAENVQWSCKASLPEELKLGSTEVSCEGYESAEDPWVLKGSCGVEYRLVLTGKGEERFGRSSGGGGGGGGWYEGVEGAGGGSKFAKWLFLVTFVVVLVVILRSFVLQWMGRRTGGPRRPPTTWGGFGGGGGGNDDDDPPPPYDPYPRNYGTGKKSTPRAPRTNSGTSRQQQQQGWRPGFWTGAAAGAAFNHVFNSRGNTRTQPDTRGTGRGLFGGRTGGSSTWGTQPSSSSSTSSSPPTFSSSRHESTGFGSTSRR